MTTDFHNIAEARPPRPSRRRALFHDLAIWRSRIATWLHNDLATPAIWTPVAIGVGAGVYFGLKAEPPFVFGLMALATSFAFLIAAPSVRIWGAAVTLASLGFVAADWRATSVATPILDRDIGISAITGGLCPSNDPRIGNG